jgi:AraC-like DNA-binding protein
MRLCSHPFLDEEPLMPIFMDRHEVPGATAADVAIAHQKDLGVQSKYKCRAMTYWFDESRAVAFCLIEAPDAEAVMQMHNEAHGLIPNRIIQVHSELVEAFLGRIGDPSAAEIAGDLGIPVFEESAFRTVLAVELKDVAILAVRHGVAATNEILRAHDAIIASALRRFRCGRVTKMEDLYLVTFPSTSNGVECAKQIQSELNALSVSNDQTSASTMSVGMALSAGEPVADQADLFGDAIQSAKRMCRLAHDNRIFIAAAVANEYRKEKSLAPVSEESLTFLDPAEGRFLNELMEVAEEHWNDGQFQVEDLARRVGKSKSQLNRMLTSLTGYSPKELLRDFRLRRASELLAARRGNVTEVAFEAGFSSAAYFAKSFQERFGLLPSVFLKATR